jgi:hypothetical protein
MELGRRVLGRPFGHINVSIMLHHAKDGEVETYVVDEDINSPEFFNCRCDCSIDGIVVAYVSHFVDDLAARIGSLQLLLQCNQLTLVIVNGGHMSELSTSV